ncbi:hypothetical protein [Clostridium beijerinckii]|jgi:hypothetical protein|uniref:CRISPR/Cas system-associated protein Cas7 (RAMP superfamily) n=2 Tax=Clostridium beijerinckii TaxID=1520 RepID=A0A1S8NSD8_CLOBE|nr:hypothetical protein [Clostridium beijerinckii]ABR33846.1 hypothetical protein Cbei_1673 [Clostridium beijerinckii NCIMB 8052]AIU04903.1 hypothetical protein Cbs_1673 [Clostridium beijerinckii ATCC 35702]MBA8937289.1 CRISPR/Cas system-associated protein Cas7 (RAMP superfamily) [Clostridium beijerinckii]MBF7811550.1 hypothetical protein [Clostridium beijerinckii]MBF7812273.1 hypothetical protein [Clostridium beijerinckii]
MKDVTIDTIKDTIRDLPEGEQEVILYLTEIFKGEEETINEYIKNELIDR